MTAHQREAWAADRSCQECGDLIPLPRALRPKTKYCSYECYMKATERRIEERLRARYSSTPSRQYLEKLPLDELIRVAMDAHFALWGRGHCLVMNRLRGMLSEHRAEEVRLVAERNAIQARIAEIEGRLSRRGPLENWLAGKPPWERADAK